MSSTSSIFLHSERKIPVSSNVGFRVKFSSLLASCKMVLGWLHLHNQKENYQQRCFTPKVLVQASSLHCFCKYVWSLWSRICPGSFGPFFFGNVRSNVYHLTSSQWHIMVPRHKRHGRSFSRKQCVWISFQHVRCCGSVDNVYSLSSTQTRCRLEWKRQAASHKT